MNLDLAILKSILSNKKYSLEFASNCDPKVFAPEYWNFANSVISYTKVYKELPTLRVLTERLEKNKSPKHLIDNVSKTWNQVQEFDYNVNEYRHDLDKIKTRFAEKHIFMLKDRLVNLSPGSFDLAKEITEIQKSIKVMGSVHSDKTYDSKSTKEYLSTFVDLFKAKRTDVNFNTGLKVGYSFFDYATNGIRPADLILVAGESGFGKSLFLNNIGVQVWLQNNNINQKTNFTEGKDVIYFSLEMPYEDCFNRFLSKLSGVPTRILENPKLANKIHLEKIRLALDFIDKYPHQFKIVDITSPCANDIEAILDDDEDFDSIFIDYLGIMNSNDNSDDQDWLKQGKIAFEVRSIGRRKSKPIFSAVQLNRKTQAKEPSENIGLSRLARSGTIATHATHVIQIENRDKEELFSDFNYHFIKNRRGPKGKGTLFKDLACATLIDKPFEESEEVHDFEDFDDDISATLEEFDL